MNANPYDTPASSNVARPEPRRRIEDNDATRSSRFKATLIAVSVWQLVCLAMMYVYGYLIGHLVVAAYTLFYGDIQASYGRFERLSTYIGWLVITLPASVVAMAIVDKLSARKGTPTRKLLTVGCWELVTMLVLATSYEFGFPYMINQLGWRLFGPPTEIYSFQNLVLHRIIAWLLCTIPIVSLAVWSYTRSCARKLADDQPRGRRIAPAHTAEQSDARETSAQSVLNSNSTPRSP